MLKINGVLFYTIYLWLLSKPTLNDHKYQRTPGEY